MTLHSEIARNLSDVRARMRAAAEATGRPADAVRLLAVSKTFGIEHIRAAVAAGQEDFGENRVQEALQKMDGSADLKVRWHLIGTLQSNKARRAAERFSAIHSIDSQRLLDVVDTAATAAGATPKLLVQVDLGSEATKHGAPPAEAAEIVRAAVRCHSARLVGLMTIPPFFDDPEKVRPYFSELRELRDALLKEGLDPAMLQELSMGMSHDFEIAVQEGATIVRIGTAIFGTRHV